MESARKLWIGLAVLLVGSFAVLLAVGGEIYRQAPPLPERVVTEGGDVAFKRDDVELGRRVWQTTGGMQLGSIWGMAAMSRRIGRLIGCIASSWPS